MRQKIAKITSNAKKSITDPRKRKAWQSGIGITIFALFVLSSVVVSRTVQALNQAAGSYGYYGGTYGYNSATVSSDFFPSTPGSQVAGAGNAMATITWTAVTTTEGSTNLDNFSSYVVYYSTTQASVLDSSNAGTNASGASRWTSSNDSSLATQGSSGTAKNTTITGLTNGSTYYFAVYAVDNAVNYSDAPAAAVSAAPSTSGSGVTASTGGGGGTSSGVSSGAITTPAPTVTTAPTVAPTTAVTVTTPAVVADAAQLVAQLGVARNTALETSSQTKVTQSATEFKVTLDATSKAVATNFVTYGISTATVKLGSGERLALVRDQLETLGRVSLTALEQLANGQKPTDRNLSNEQKQVSKVLSIFQKLTAKSVPNFKNTKEDLAWNTLQYRIRFTRDLNKERAGIGKFKALYSRNPASPLDWAAVRAYGYALK